MDYHKRKIERQWSSRRTRVAHVDRPHCAGCILHVLESRDTSASLRREARSHDHDQSHRQTMSHVVGVKKNPAITVVKDMLGLMRQYAVEFGMTPSSRSRIEVLPPLATTSPSESAQSRAESYFNDDAKIQ